MAEPSFLDPSPFHNFPEFHPSDLSFSDANLFPDGAFALTSDLDLDDLDLDFSVDDLINDDGSPDPQSNTNSNSNSNSNSNLTANSNPASPVSGNSVINEPVKHEDESNSRKRTKDDDEEAGENPNPNPSSRSLKIRRSDETNSSSCTFSPGADEDEKRKARLMRNRESAQLSRQRKKHYVEELEEKVKIMNSTIADLNGKISFYMAENARLHQQLNSNGNEGGGNGGNSTTPPPAVIYPPPYPLPWIPYPGYPMRPNGHAVPYIPIPRLKTQQPASAPRGKKTESRKSESKTKKVASVSLFGVFLIMMVFGGVMNFGFEGNGDKVYGGLSSGNSRILSVNGRRNVLNSTEEFRQCGGKMGIDSWVKNNRYQHEKKENCSESLPALLYVPRNGKHVEINGNLIIHSVLASERAMAQAKSKVKGKESTGKEGTGLVIPGNLVSALAVPNGGREIRNSKTYRSSAEHPRPRALPSDSRDEYRDNVKSSLADGPLQQWFREGLAGPILSSGTCTEVFQFEVSPSSAIVPSTSVVNSTEKLPSGKTKNRRIMYPLPIPLNGTTVNTTQHVGKTAGGNGTFHSNNDTIHPSMVVSILADPREAGDGDSDGMITPKSLSRIFVVVLVDSVKYVTYSCVLPLKSHGPHLVN